MKTKKKKSAKARAKKNSEADGEEKQMTFEEYIENIRRIVIETLTLVKGMSYENALNMSIDELLLWHKKGIEVYKSMRGIE